MSFDFTAEEDQCLSKGDSTAKLTTSSIRSRVSKILETSDLSTLSVELIQDQLQRYFEQDVTSHASTIQQCITSHIKNRHSPQRTRIGSPVRRDFPTTVRRSSSILRTRLMRQHTSTDTDPYESKQTTSPNGKRPYANKTECSTSSDLVHPPVVHDGDAKQVEPIDAKIDKSLQLMKKRSLNIPVESLDETKTHTESARMQPRPSSSKGKLSSALPVVFPSKLTHMKYTNALVQVDTEDDVLDISGDTGAIGRLNTTPSGVLLDLQGHRYAGPVVPCLSHAVVSISSREARVEAVVNDFIQLEHLQNVIEDMRGSLTEGTQDVEELFRVEDVDGNMTSGAQSESNANGALSKGVRDSKKRKSEQKPAKMLGATSRAKRGKSSKRK